MRRVLPVVVSLGSLLGSAAAWAQPDEPAPPPDDAEEPAEDSPPDAPRPVPPEELLPETTIVPTPLPEPRAPRFDPDAPPPGGWRLMLSDLTIIRLNPLGLETRGRFGLQKRLYYSEKAISKTNFGFVGLYPKLNPASAQLGVGGELQPASIFNLRALVEVQQYFGTFGFLQSFPTADVNYSDDRLKTLRDSTATPPQSAALFHASIQPLLQLKVGPVAVRSLVQLDCWNADLRAGDVVFYEATFDTLLPDRGWTLATDTDVLYTGRPGLAIGLRHSSVTPLYADRHAAGDADNGHQRLGLFAAYTLRDRGPSSFNKPTVILIASWYLSHRYRTGEPDALPADHTADDYVTRAFPYLLAGFAFESDFLKVAP